MKKYVIIASILVTLAGCSASASIAQAKDIPVIKQHQVKQKTLQEMVKPQRNTIQMERVIKYLKTRVGRTSYVFSGSSPRGWDCSGLVRWTYERFGIVLPHSANAQGHIGTRVSKPKLGDIVVFAYNGSTSFYHAAIYIGNGKIINAHRGLNSTIIQPLTDYKNGQIRFVRIVKTL
jgi:cell wall-associated NlpC family hydrolase